MPLNANEQYMLQLINAERAKVGAPALVFDATLVRSSEAHSQWMINTDIFSHTGVDGSSPGDRMHEAGYTTQAGWGENIAYASLRSPSGTLDEVALLHANLMNSPGHRANILNPNYKAIGVGFEVGEFRGHEGAVVTQNFGTKLTSPVSAPPAPGTPPAQPVDQILTGNWWDNTLIGGAGDDVIRGLGGRDKIVGAAGDDVLWGGSGADRFVFSGDFGHDTIKDFENGLDHFDLRGSGWTLAELRLVTTNLDWDGRNDDAVIRVGDDTFAVINGAGKIDASDFWL